MGINNGNHLGDRVDVRPCLAGGVLFGHPPHFSTAVYKRPSGYEIDEVLRLSDYS